jgi:hypothetical protein
MTNCCALAKELELLQKILQISITDFVGKK